MNILTPTPTFDSDGWQTQGKIRGQFSSADVGYMTRAAIESGKKGLAFNAGFTYQSAGDLRRGGKIKVQEPSNFRSYAFDSKMVVERTRSSVKRAISAATQDSSLR